MKNYLGAIHITGLLLAFALLCTGCSTTPSPREKLPPLPPASTETTWPQHLQHVQALQYWQADGRLAVKQGNKGGNANFVWTQYKDHYEIKLFGPFGSGAVYITGNQHHVQLKEANGKIHTAKTPEQLLHNVAGWHVPLTGLHYWLRGIPVPQDKTKKHKLTQEGTLKQLQQEGWNIVYEDYHHTHALPLPSKMHLRNRDLRVKLLVKSWKVQ